MARTARITCVTKDYPGGHRAVVVSIEGDMTDDECVRIMDCLRAPVERALNEAIPGSTTKGGMIQ